jgi:uncharacterized membrane protein YbaN (DUF454 family)
MTIYGILGILVLVFCVFGIVTYQIATKDFSLRKFISLKEKNKWRRIIYFLPFGPICYILKFKNVPKTS